MASAKQLENMLKRKKAKLAKLNKELAAQKKKEAEKPKPKAKAKAKAKAKPKK